MSLVLPAPVNAHPAEALPVGGPDAALDDASLPESERLKRKLIYPPPEIRTLIDRTASALHRSANPASLEAKIREGQKADPKFSFLNASDPYATYYRYAQARLREGLVDAAVPANASGAGGGAGGEEAALTGEGGAAAAGGRPKEPRTLEFALDRPGMPAVDLDVLKLTALFTARRGRSFLASLSQREGRNSQFDFLRPTHSLYPLFQRLVQQYTRVLGPSEETLAELAVGKERRPGRELALAHARERAEYEKYKRERSKKREDELEAREIAFAQIDWQDFVVVETIDFTAADEALALPAPTSIRELEARTLTQKHAAASLDGSGAADGESAEHEVSIVPPADDGGEKTEAELERERKEQEAARAREVQRQIAQSQGTMKIRKDYVPKTRQAQPTGATVMHNGQAIPVDEIAEQLRIELLDPKWKENKKAAEARRTQSSLLQQGADVSTSLRELAKARTDMFGNDQDDDARKAELEAAEANRKKIANIAWDGFTASAETTRNKYQAGANFDAQIAAIHKSKGLAPVADGAGPIGPGPAAFPQPPPAQPETSTSTGGTISAAPTGPSGASGLPPIPQASYASLPQPPTGLPAAAALPPGMHPSRMAALQNPDFNIPYSPAPAAPAAAAYGASPIPPFGVSPTPPPSLPPPAAALAPSTSSATTRPREDDTEQPEAKRARLEGHVVSEAEWLATHPYPITLTVQLPTVAGKPELDGSQITLSAIGLNMTVGVLRERIQEATKTTLSLSKMRLDTAGGKVLNNKSTLAAVNLASGDTLTLNIRK